MHLQFDDSGNRYGIHFLSMIERRIALCVGQWSSESVLYAWTYLRHCILRARTVH